MRGMTRKLGLLATAAVVFFGILSCGSSSSPTTAPSCPASNLVVAAVHESSSSDVGLLSLDGGSKFYAGGDSLGGDPALASTHERLFWVNRYRGSVIELDPRCATPIGQPWSANDDAGGTTNPQDVAFDPKNQELWVARFAVGSILIKSADGQTRKGTVDLSSVTGTTRNPYMSSIRIIDDVTGVPKAYVTLEMLTEVGPNLSPKGPSYLVRIDVKTRAIEGVLQLQGKNPFGLIVEQENAQGTLLYLAEPGSFSDAHETDAGIEVVHLDKFTSTLLVRESDIGASVTQVSIQGGCGTAIVADPSQENYTSMISFDATTGAIVTPLAQRFLYTSAGFDLSGMAWLDGGLNVVGDGTPVAPTGGFAVHVVAASSTCGLTEKPAHLFAPLPPIAFSPVP